MCGITYNGTPYYFQKNLQGDIIAIVDASGTVVGKYSYDAWGKCTITYQNSRAGVTYANPFRYRGYYFDQETGFYYLQSRYYDPSTGRFINGDEATIVVMPSSQIAKYNLISYCYNSPIMEVDNSGCAVNDYIHAIGIQFAVTLGGVNLGIEFLWDTKKWKFYVFFFAGGSVSRDASKGYNIITDYIYPMFKNVSKNANAIMKAISKSNLSISFIGVFGGKKQKFPSGYCGTFTGVSLSIKIFWINVAFSGAIGKNSNGVIGSVGVGVSLTNGASFGRTYYVQLTGENAFINNLKTWLDTIKGTVKSYTDKFKKAARVLS